MNVTLGYHVQEPVRSPFRRTCAHASLSRLRDSCHHERYLRLVLATLARDGYGNIAEADVITALQTFHGLWAQLFPAEKVRRRKTRISCAP